MDSPNKPCELDPIPTGLLKKCVDVLLPLITEIVNKSAGMGCFPHDLNYNLIRPQLKRNDLDNDELSNYKPVSNLFFLIQSHREGSKCKTRWAHGYKQYAWSGTIGI